MSATLLDYVSAICRRVTADKAMRGIEPAAVTYTDVIAEARDDILDCMRALAISDDYEGHITVNHVPMLIPRQPPRPPDDIPLPAMTLSPADTRTINAARRLKALSRKLSQKVPNPKRQLDNGKKL